MLLLLGEGFVPEVLNGMGICGCCWLTWFLIGRGKWEWLPIWCDIFALWIWIFGEEAFIRGYGREGVSVYP